MVAKKSNDTFVKEVTELVGSEYVFNEPYINSSSKIKVTHVTCGNTYKVTPNGFLRGNRCPFCNGNNAKRKTTKSFAEEVKNIVGDEYTVIGEYVARDVNILMRHNVCGREYYVQPGNFLYRSRCVVCYYNSIRLSEKEVKCRIRECLGSDYHLVSRYIDSQKKIVVHHDRCGKDFSVKADDIFQKHSGCPYCSSSRGEDYVRTYLRDNDYIFSEQVRFPNLRDINPLSYDFMITKHKILIEYQGSQHFYPKTWGGIKKSEAKRRFIIQKKHDSLKRNYAFENNYKLIEIPYTCDSLTKVYKFLDKSIKNALKSNAETLQQTVEEI